MYVSELNINIYYLKNNQFFINLLGNALDIYLYVNDTQNDICLLSWQEQQ